MLLVIVGLCSVHRPSSFIFTSIRVPKRKNFVALRNLVQSLLQLLEKESSSSLSDGKVWSIHTEKRGFVVLHLRDDEGHQSFTDSYRCFRESCKLCVQNGQSFTIQMFMG